MHQLETNVDSVKIGDVMPFLRLFLTVFNAVFEHMLWVIVCFSALHIPTNFVGQ